MQAGFIQYKTSRLHYNVYGKGDALLFCFHGYGRESKGFAFLEKAIGAAYTLIAIDLPFHGHTEWKDKLTFPPALLVRFINQIREEQKRADQKFSLLGFSMGGRIALHLTMLMSSEIDRLVLIAPDGLHFNFWRWIATDNWLGNKLLGYTIHHPKWIIWLLNRMQKSGIMHKSLTDFVHYYVDDEEQRLLLYKRWTAMRRFKPNLSRLKKIVRKNGIQVRMMFGLFDRVIPVDSGMQFLKGIKTNARIKVLESGHNLLTEAHLADIVQLFND